MWDSTMFLSTLTPKFYVALTGTSSLISGLILILNVSLNHISPWIGGGDTNENGNGTNGSTNSQQNNVPECKVWRNPLNLYRGAEYQRFYWATNKEPLTYYDMNLSAQDHQTFFTCEADAGKAEYEIMQTAWRERNPLVRIKAAHKALETNPDCAPAYILLAEEEATTITEAEKILKTGTETETNYRKTQQIQHQGSLMEAQHRRDTNHYLKCRRTQMFSGFSQYDDISLPKSATICITPLRFKSKISCDKFSPDIASKRGLTTAEMAAVEAIHRAVEFNPHVPKYLLEMKPLILPPETSYTFFHLAHWKNMEGALNLLHCTWEGTFRMLPYPLERGIYFIRTLLVQNSLTENCLCSFTALLALLTHQYPEPMGCVAKSVLNWLSLPVYYIYEKVEGMLPSNLLQQLSRI
ncbi:hypothetical protein RI129_000201 [Pyrocoelia pectoralis]|uniref:Protein ST7 homolog n=1 Tax=Pyrocoelia pectoralis TaxID=417401 RepID=A0AAN7UZQ1_9COLE